MRRLLVTGASGFLGSRVAEFFREKYEICAPGHGEMDITDRAGVMARLREWRPDAVVHCAAISDVGRCEREPERSWDINVEGSVNLAMAAGQTGAKCLLCSSDQVYFGSAAAGPHREDEVLEPGNLYGREKLYAEKRCLEVNPDCVLLRLSWMYDARTLNEREHGDFLRTLLGRLGSSEKISYPVHDLRGLTDVNEVTKNMEAAFALQGGVYNFGSPNEKNMYETVYGLFQELHWDVGRLAKEEEAYASRPRSLVMSQEKLNAGGIYFTDTQQRLIHCIRSLEQNFLF